MTPHAADVHGVLASLAGRLRLEAVIGAVILLATALMGQSLPARTAAAAGGASLGNRAPTGGQTIPASITASSSSGPLRVALTIVPPAVGTTTISAMVSSNGAVLNGDEAALLVALFQPNIKAGRANVNLQAHGTTFSARTSLPATGLWRADVKVRTSSTLDYVTIPFTFTAGAGAAFALPAAGAPGLSLTPGVFGSPNMLTISGVQGAAVRVLSQSIDMNMGIIPFVAANQGGGRWRVSGLFIPMIGRWGLTVQVQKSAGAQWTTLRRAIYKVPVQGRATLLSAS